jgi:hypothetical protein
MGVGTGESVGFDGASGGKVATPMLAVLAVDVVAGPWPLGVLGALLDAPVAGPSGPELPEALCVADAASGGVLDAVWDREGAPIAELVLWTGVLAALVAALVDASAALAESASLTAHAHSVAAHAVIVNASPGRAQCRRAVFAGCIHA